MKKLLRLCVLGPAFGVLLVDLQFFPAPRHSGEADGPQDIDHHYTVPADVHRVLAAACYDCHSNHTDYPWYANVQPVGWWLAHHVTEGRRPLNFSEFGTYGTHRAARALDLIADQVDAGDMPLRSYTWMHPAARLTAGQRKKIVDWAQDLHDKLAPE